MANGGGTGGKTNGYLILHDAVKIGLGALIGILGSVWVTHLSNKHSLETLREEHAFQRESDFIGIRRKKIEAARDELTLFTNALADYQTNIYKAATETGMADIGPSQLEVIIEKEENFSEAFKRLQDAGGQLKLVNAELSYDTFDNYAELAEEFFRKCHRKNKNLTPEEIAEWRKKIHGSYVSLLDALSDDFGSYSFLSSDTGN